MKRAYFKSSARAEAIIQEAVEVSINGHAEPVEVSLPLRQGQSTKRERCFDRLSMTF
jgi:hypothetical protein